VSHSSRFTKAEAAVLRRLIAEKVVADRSGQKRLRDQMRAMGFYITDYTSQRGFTVSDFDDLVSRGAIVITDGSPSRGTRVRQPTPTSTPRPSSRAAAQAQAARARRARAAKRFKPEPVDLLLVAEAPPSSLDRYFYFTDVREQDSLFRYIVRAVLGREPTREAKTSLLDELRDRGVFLVDLQEDPRDERLLSEFVPKLVNRCRRLDPSWIVLIKATVFDAAHADLTDAGLPVSSVRVPFPGSGQQKRFLEAFALALKERPTER
jgi:hypothetical protein